MIRMSVRTILPSCAQALRWSVKAKLLFRNASTSSESEIVSIVPPMAILAAAFFCTP